MKKIIIVITLFLIGTIVVAQATDSTRKEIIAELHRLKQAIITGNSEQIADFFSFPITDPTLCMSIHMCEDKYYYDTIPPVDKQKFIKNIKCIIPNEFTLLFKTLNIDRLNKATRIEKIVNSKMNKMCRNQYSISIDKNNVIINFALVRKESDIDDECGEYTIEFTFAFDGKNLLFKEYVNAG